MMSATQSATQTQAREKAATRRRRRRVDFTRPEHVDPNHPVPWLGWDVRQAVPLRPSIVYQALASLQPRQLPPGADGKPRGSIIRSTSNVRIKNATAKFMPGMTSALPAAPMALRTVGHAIEHLRRKGFIELWEMEGTPKNNPVGTSYRIVPWEEVLQGWANNPEIATAAGTRRGFYVWGKGKWHLTPADVAAWKVDHAIAERDPAAHAAAANFPDPASQPAQPAPAAPPKHRMTVEEALLVDTAVVHRAILDTGVRSVEPEHAAALLALARGVAAAIPADSIAGIIGSLARGYSLKGRANPHKYGWTSEGGPVFWTVGWFRNDMAGAVHAWLADQAAAQRATGTGR